jgi:hypothetical protein
MPNSSTLLIQNSRGHGANSMPSLCTARAQRAYWAGYPPQNGTVCCLGADVGLIGSLGTVCEVSGSVFLGTGDAQVEALSVEDRELLDAQCAIGQAIRDMRMPGLAQLL